MDTHTVLRSVSHWLHCWHPSPWQAAGALSLSILNWKRGEVKQLRARGVEFLLDPQGTFEACSVDSLARSPTILNSTNLTLACLTPT